MRRKPKSISLETLLDAFSEVPDPRIERRKFHPLVNVLTMALFGAICGCDGWEALEMYAEMHAEYFAAFLDMPGGTPSADTFRRVFEALDPMAFQDAFRRWLQPLLGELEGQSIALDGKTLRGALAHSTERGGAFHIMHVWAVEQRLLLAQKAVDGAPGEIQAAIELLEILDLRGATVTADANSCTAAISTAVRKSDADYILALKGNRGALHRHVETLFDNAAAKNFRGIKKFESNDAAHGRTEYRLVRAIPLEELPVDLATPWTDLNTAVMVERVRAADAVTVERSFYISSHAANPKLLADKIRGHWSIENQLHHCLDVTFAEDRRRIHDENGAQNFALITRYALSMLKREPTKMSVAMKRRKASYSPPYVLQLLSGGFPQV